MGLFKPDMYRAFLIGFLIGSAAILGSIGTDNRVALVQTLLP